MGEVIKVRQAKTQHAVEKPKRETHCDVEEQKYYHPKPQLTPFLRFRAPAYHRAQTDQAKNHGRPTAAMHIVWNSEIWPDESGKQVAKATDEHINRQKLRRSVPVLHQEAKLEQAEKIEHEVKQIVMYKRGCDCAPELPATELGRRGVSELVGD